jgi:hypothetical protein
MLVLGLAIFLALCPVHVVADSREATCLERCSAASNGKVWAIYISTGPSDSGPYSFRDADTMTATGVLGTADWHRVQ